MTTQMSSVDALIIGAGPAGIAAALYLVRSEMSVALVEKIVPGGQMLNTDRIDNYPGFPEGIDGHKLAELFNNHLSKYHLERISAEVKSVRREESNFITLLGDSEIVSKVVIAASGTKHRKIGLEREDELVGRGISYCALCDGNFFRGEDVAVVGGGNSALEESLYLSRLVNKVYLIHRRDQFRSHGVYLNQCEAKENIEIMRSFIPVAFVGEQEIDGLVVEDLKNGERRRLNVKGVFLLVGSAPNNDFLPEDLQKDDFGFIITDVEMQTNIPGLYAAGDLRSKFCRQVATSIGDGVTAATTAIRYIDESRI